MKTKFLLDYKPISIRQLSTMVDEDTMRVIHSMCYGATYLLAIKGTLRIVKRRGM